MNASKFIFICDFNEIEINVVVIPFCRQEKQKKEVTNTKQTSTINNIYSTSTMHGEVDESLQATNSQ